MPPATSASGRNARPSSMTQTCLVAASALYCRTKPNSCTLPHVFCAMEETSLSMTCAPTSCKECLYRDIPDCINSRGYDHFTDGCTVHWRGTNSRLLHLCHEVISRQLRPHGTPAAAPGPAPASTEPECSGRNIPYDSC